MVEERERRRRGGRGQEERKKGRVLPLTLLRRRVAMVTGTGTGTDAVFRACPCVAFCASLPAMSDGDGKFKASYVPSEMMGLRFEPSGSVGSAVAHASRRKIHCSGSISLEASLWKHHLFRSITTGRNIIFNCSSQLVGIHLVLVWQVIGTYLHVTCLEVILADLKLIDNEFPDKEISRICVTQRSYDPPLAIHTQEVLGSGVGCRCCSNDSLLGCVYLHVPETRQPPENTARSRPGD